MGVNQKEVPGIERVQYFLDAMARIMMMGSWEKGGFFALLNCESVQTDPVLSSSLAVSLLFG